MEPTEENLKNTENAFKDMYSRLHNVPREDIEDIPVDELTNLENSLVKRANKIRFKEINAVNSKNLKKEDLGKSEKIEETEKEVQNTSTKIVTPQVSSEDTDNDSKINKDITQSDVKSTEPIKSVPSSGIPDITDLDKRLKQQTSMLPEPPSIVESAEKIKTVEEDKSANLKNKVVSSEEFKKDKNTVEPLSKLPESPELSINVKENRIIAENQDQKNTKNNDLTIEQEQLLRSEYPSVNFNEIPANETEAALQQKLKQDFLDQIATRKQETVEKNTALEDQTARSFENKAVAQEEAKPSSTTPEQSSNITVENNTFNQPAETVTQQQPSPVITPNIPQQGIPNEMAATLDSLMNLNPANLNEMIDQMTAIAMGIQKNAPIPESKSVVPSTSESSLKNINDNIVGMNKTTIVSTKELKASIDNLKAVAEQILSYLPNIQSTNIMNSVNGQSREVQQVNTGLMQRYKNEVRQQYGSDIIDLSNNRPTMPGFTI